jgi:hypothetical protein
MNSPRMSWLVMAALALAGLRWWTWPAADRAAVAVVEPVSRPVQPMRLAAPVVPTKPTEPAIGGREPELGAPRDAFAVRKPAPAPVPAAPLQVAVAAPKPFVGPLVPPPEPPPPPPPPPPFQVIGGWRDDSGSSVFLSGPQGVVHARVGDTMFGNYRVAQVTSTQVVLRQINANRDAALPVPAGVQLALTTSR